MRAEARRQLKQDKFSRTTIQVAEQTVHWTVEHKNKLIVSAIVVVVVQELILYLWGHRLSGHRFSLHFGHTKCQCYSSSPFPANVLGGRRG